MTNEIKVETTTLSSRGQVVLPQEVRERLKLVEGEKFLVMAEEDTIILKAVRPIPKEKFQTMLKTTREAIRKAGITPADLENAISRARHARSS